MKIARNAGKGALRAEVDDLLALDRDLLSSWEDELIGRLSSRLDDGLPIDEAWVAKAHRMWELLCG